MAQREIFEYTKDFGSTKKGTKKRMSLQMIKILEKRKAGKMIKPDSDKANPKAKARQTK